MLLLSPEGGISMNKVKNKVVLALLGLFITVVGQRCPQCNTRAGHKHRSECPNRRFSEVWG